MKLTSHNGEHMYGETLGEGLVGLHPTNRRNMNTVSPQKMFNHLGGGQQPIGTPLRSRIDSQESRRGVFPSLQCEESLLPSKADP